MFRIVSYRPLPLTLALLSAAIPGYALAAESDTTAAEPISEDLATASSKPESAPGKQPATPKTHPSTPVTTMSEVVVTAKRFTDMEERRYGTAAKIVVGREELDRYGDSSLGDIMKRMPGVTLSGTPGRGGDIRMRGLGNGYTQILLNGEPAPRGFSMDSLAPEQIERVEIMRAPVAEHSARAIAGTINIVLREDFVKLENEARPTLGWEQGRLQPSISLQRGDRIGAFNYNINANLYQRDVDNASETHTSAVTTSNGTPTLEQIQQDNSRSRTDGLQLSSRLSWRLQGGDNLSIQPFIMQSRNQTDGRSHLDQSLGNNPPPFADANWRNDNNRTVLRAIANWQIRLPAGAKLELRANGGIADIDATSSRQEYAAGGAPSHSYASTDDTRDKNLSLAAKYSRPLGQEHNLATGLEAERGQREENLSNIEDGVLLLPQFGSNLSASTQRFAAYAQDEWDISPLWSAYGGLRWESIRTHSAWEGNVVDNNSSVLSPLLHSVWRFSEESKDQVRLGLTRSYKSPTLANLNPRPSLASGYPSNGGNTPTNPDQVGNPYLEPELAWGLDLAYEHYLTEGGMLGANLFARHIDDLIRNVTSLQNVSWSPVPRWVSSPQNVGSAKTQGVELEAKLRLAEILAGAPQISINANFSRFWSEVEGVTGPDNRLDQQPNKTANLGLDYKWRGLPLSLGGNINWVPAFTVQQSDTQLYYQGLKRDYNAYALWRFDPNTQLRLTASNLLQADYDTASRHISALTDQIATTSNKTYLYWAARLEMKF